MASSSKRKQTMKNPHAAEYEIVRPCQDAAQPSATSRTFTFDRNPSGRLGQHTEIAEVEISAEDLAALAQDPEFSSLPDDKTLNYEYFEQTVQEDDNEVEPIVQQVPPVKVKKVKLNILAEWLPFRDTHVHELTQHEGWADLSKQTAFTFAVLKQFHHLTLQGKTTAYDFHNSLVHATDNTGLKPPPRRYNKFMMVMRWWRHIKMLKQAGRGHDPAGVVATEQGSLAVECPACLHDGRNLPANWKWLPMAIAWIYTLYLAMDANFCLKLRNCHIKNDPELGPGWAYCANETHYQNEMDQYGDQTEISNCDSGLHAIDHANT
ncbi:hypothetical protein PILCRDRAFT_15828 [Piloderma croceum F 1598]|uniref:CxC2-like cysteine cluster KDZ transposase-associated domain-containing protein n=1 Tax=Piloderma croceum (strain F 1598) TaxID=765440 RepID=A0A0C3B630_PILCF|nr:hypothetical protein PILCRDRAFT_15828 [Piloderma croceum F 1598]